ncbi:hypothetical protein PIB30_073759 [Stylosanthes scabra]|uniref:Uncharacterized protein n=1 Tax=Stylosanthes scabra TaxID=79078 RepID=A0ABU6QPL1_9FABA|nr:hypothetical protein [Stylosanthes scabra]
MDEEEDYLVTDEVGDDNEASRSEAGCTGFVAKHFFGPTKPEPKQCKEDNAVVSWSHIIRSKSPGKDEDDGSHSWSKCTMKKTMMRRKGSRTGVRMPKVEVRRVVEFRLRHRNGGKKLLPHCLKSKETTTRTFAFCSSNDKSLFGIGVSLGIRELCKTMNEAAKVVEELKSELSRRKSTCSCTCTCTHQIKDSGMESCRMRKLNKTRGNDDGDECGSTGPTEESFLRVQEFDHLEAEFELELKKLYLHDEQQLEVVPIEGWEGTNNSFNHHCNGILASELNQKLSRLLIEQQEHQILELESELHVTQSKLHDKEAELHALKNSVKLLTQLPLSMDSDDESKALQEKQQLLGPQQYE